MGYIDYLLIGYRFSILLTFTNDLGSNKLNPNVTRQLADTSKKRNPNPPASSIKELDGIINIFVIHVFFCHSCIFLSFVNIFVIHVFFCHL